MPKYRVLVTAKAARDTAPDELAGLQGADVEVVHSTRGGLSEAELTDLLPGVDAVWAGMDAYTARALAAADRLKAIVRWGVGIDTIDLEAATRAGVVVVNTPGLTTDSVADYAFGLMIDLARHLTETHTSLRGGRWAPIWGVDVWRKRLGLVGLGSIGKGMARRASGFAMTVVAHDPYVDPAAARELGVELMPLNAVLERADYVSLHANLTGETRGMIGDVELRRMKPSAYLINCGRGPLVQTDALVRALREGWIAGAAVDVYDVEPAPADHPLLSLPNCLTLPHGASSSIETARAINRECVDSILAVLRGERPRFVCNPEVYERLGIV